MSNKRRRGVKTETKEEDDEFKNIPWAGGGRFAPQGYPNTSGSSEADTSKETIDRLSQENTRLSMENARLSNAYHSALTELDRAQRQLRDLNPNTNWEMSWIPTATRFVTEMIATSLATRCLEYRVGALSDQQTVERDRVQELSQSLFSLINSKSNIGSIIHQTVYEEIMKKHNEHKQEEGGPNPNDPGVMDRLAKMFTIPRILSDADDEASDPSEGSCWVLLATGNGRYTRVDLPRLHQYTDTIKDHAEAIYRSRVNTKDVWAVD